MEYYPIYKVRYMVPYNIQYNVNDANPKTVNCLRSRKAQKYFYIGKNLYCFDHRLCGFGSSRIWNVRQAIPIAA